LPTYGNVEEKVEARDEPRSNGDGSVCSEPERGAKREELVSRVEVASECHVWITGGSIFGDDDDVSFKELIGFVARQEKLEEIGRHQRWGSADDFSRVTQSDLVRVCQLSEAEESEKTTKEHGYEKEIVVEGRGSVMRNDDVEVFDAEGAFTWSWSSEKSHTTCEGTRDQNWVTILADKREIWFELVTNPRKIGADGVGFYVVAHEDCEETEGVGSGVEREIMETDELEVGI
jgi:hypothetical protein